MKLHKKLTILATAIFCLSLTSCKTPTGISNEYGMTAFETQCLGVDGDGTQTLRVWGNGNNRGEAIEQAKRNAVRDVIFKGITAGNGECNKKPLVNEVNAAQKYESYFNSFFSKGGAYNKYVVLDEKRTSRIKSKNSTREAWGVVVTIDRAQLRQRLIEDNILKP